MVGGGLDYVKSAKEYPARATRYVATSCLVAASGGLIFGNDVGISGGVTGMDDFLKKFFPTVLRRKNAYTSSDGDYCKYDNHVLELFTSSLYLAALAASWIAAVITRKYGRISSIKIGGLSFLIGAIMNGLAVNLTMLILGRILLGIGVGFGNQAVPMYLSEMAPPKFRGSLNIMFQLAVTFGILIAKLINYGTAKIHSWGWRLSLGLAGVPAILMTLGGFMLPDTPNSLIERGHFEQGKSLLLKIRGVPNVDEEYNDLVEASAAANSVASPFRNILQRRNRPQLVTACFIPFFQQVTGINAIMFYAPVLFQTLGFKDDASLYSAVITGAVNVVGTFVSIATVDRYGRRKLFLQGGIQMFLSQVAIGLVLALEFGGSKSLSKGLAVCIVFLICVYVSAFAWSWGPLGWLVPSEIFPLETRSAGQAINVTVNMLFTFIIAQAFLSILCHFKFGIFLFFAAWVVIMSFSIFFLPETRNVLIEEIVHVWRVHWFWKKIMGLDEHDDEENTKTCGKVTN